MKADRGISLKVIRLPRNGGLGNALSVGLESCSHELIARMDSDDISHPRRFERQLRAFADNPVLDIVGGQITEFVGDEENIVARREVPLEDAEIKRQMRRRCPMNHVTVMFKKGSVEEAGGYVEVYHNEDYSLWIRMMLHDAVFANVPFDLVNVRTGEAMSSRRGGMRYFRGEKSLQKLMLDNGIINPAEYAVNNAIRFAGEVAAPNWLRNGLFRFTRERYVPAADDDCMGASLNVREDDPVAQMLFSVLMSVYKNDDPVYLGEALESVVNQTVQPNEIVLVIDGPVPAQLDEAIATYQSAFSR